MKVSPSTEDYLKNIYELQEREGLARTKKLADRMQVSLGTITNTVELLEKNELIKHTRYKGVTLTAKGNRIALDVIRRHRLTERLLTDILRMDWSNVHEIACKLEHDITEEVIKPLGKILGHPKTCPHGNPIPTKCGGIIEDNTRPLIDLEPQEIGTIVKIAEEKSEVLRYLDSLGIELGTIIKVEKKIKEKNSEFLQLKDIDPPLSRKIASSIWVRKR
ncbi:metal-dependent transcriptional regulator [[Eubacterium] cellulosolvens]